MLCEVCSRTVPMTRKLSQVERVSGAGVAMEVLTEPEIQLLIALLELTFPVETPNNNFYRFYPKTLEDAATYFRKFRADWSAAYESLRM